MFAAGAGQHFHLGHNSNTTLSLTGGAGLSNTDVYLDGEEIVDHFAPTGYVKGHLQTQFVNAKLQANIPFKRDVEANFGDINRKTGVDVTGEVSLKLPNKTSYAGAAAELFVEGRISTGGLENIRDPFNKAVVNQAIENPYQINAGVRISFGNEGSQSKTCPAFR